MGHRSAVASPYIDLYEIHSVKNKEIYHLTTIPCDEKCLDHLRT